MLSKLPLKTPLKPQHVLIPLGVLAAILAIVAGTLLVKTRIIDPRIVRKPLAESKPEAKKGGAEAKEKTMADLAKRAAESAKADASSESSKSANDSKPSAASGDGVAMAAENPDAAGGSSGTGTSGGGGTSPSPPAPRKAPPLPRLDPLMKAAIRKAVLQALWLQAIKDGTGPVDTAAVDKALNALRVKSAVWSGKTVKLAVTGGRIKQAIITLRKTGNHYNVIDLVGYSLK